MSYRDMIDRVENGRRICGVVSATNGTMVGARRLNPPSNKKWVVRAKPETGAKDIILTVHKDGNPSSACQVSKKLLFGPDSGLLLQSDATQRIDKPPPVTIAGASADETLTEYECSRTVHDPVVDENDVPVLDENDVPVTTPRVVNFKRSVPQHLVITATLSTWARGNLILYVDPPSGFTDDVGLKFYNLPDTSNLTDAEATEALRRTHCHAHRYHGGWSIDFKRGEVRRSMVLSVIDDDIDEGDEDFELEFYFKVIRNRVETKQSDEGYGAYMADNEVRVTIRNEDPIPKEWVANFSHSVGKTIVRNVSSRLDTLRETDDGEVGTWVNFDHDSFSNGPLSANTNGFTIGVDRSWEAFDAGVAISSATGDGRYKAMDLGGSLLGVYPYVQIQPQEHYSLWGTAGMSQGHITVNTGKKDYKTDMSMTMGAVGVHWDLLELMGTDFAFESDLMLVRAQSGAVADMKASRTRSRRLHSAIGAVRAWEFENFRINGEFDVGLVHEAGDVEEGYGTEANIGVDFEHRHLSAGVSVGTSAVNGGDASYNTNVAAHVNYDWLGDKQGLIASYKLAVSWFGDGEAGGATATLGYGYRIREMLWTSYVLHAGQHMEIGLDGAHRKGAKLRIAAGDRSVKVTVGLSW